MVTILRVIDRNLFHVTTLLLPFFKMIIRDFNEIQT